MSKLQPFVRWVGGKRKHVPFLVKHMPKSYGKYFEPFLGGGALFLAVQPKTYTVNDANLGLISNWLALATDPNSFQDLIEALFQKYNGFNDQKAMFEDLREEYNLTKEKFVFNENNLLLLATLFFFLMFTSYNATYRENRKGEYNNGFAGFEHIGPIDHINLEEIGHFLKKHQDHQKIRCGSWQDAIEDVRSGDFIYFDPPYYTDNAIEFNSYHQDGFGKSDHIALAKKCRELDALGVYWMVSNSDHPLIWKLYKGFRITPLLNKQSNGGQGDKYGRRTKKQELLIQNY